MDRLDATVQAVTWASSVLGVGSPAFLYEA